MFRAALLGSLLAGCLGGPVPQAPVCGAYVACLRALDTEAEPTNLDRFVEGGACWVNGETAELCGTGCLRGLDWLRAHSDALPKECLP